MEEGAKRICWTRGTLRADNHLVSERMGFLPAGAQHSGGLLAQEPDVRDLQFGMTILGAIILAPGFLHADVESGPKAGSKMETLKAVAATGDEAGKEVNFTDQRKD